jgi:hypothetical protein
MERKSMTCRNSSVSPPEARLTVSTSWRSPGMKRSCPTRSSGPDGTSRMPVASTTITPGMPSANRRYQSRTAGVTSPPSVARHGTMAGTQVRVRASSAPIATGLNQRERAASSAVGQRTAGSACLRCSGGVHING